MISSAHLPLKTTDSLFRRAVKRALAPIVSGRMYQRIQAAVMAWDIKTLSWYEPEIDLLQCAIAPGETVLDIGANFGLYSYHLSRAAGPSGFVVCFEPVPWTFEILTMVVGILRLKNLRLISKGCSDHSGQVTFRAPLQGNNVISAGNACIASGDAAMFENARFRYREFYCEVVALDEFLAQSEPVSFIKCDVEGAEALVFQGAASLVKRDMPTILCEIDKKRFASFDTDFAAFLRFFNEIGYGLYHYQPRGKGKGALRQTDGLRDDCVNYFLIPAPRLHRFGSWL